MGKSQEHRFKFRLEFSYKNIKLSKQFNKKFGKLSKISMKLELSYSAPNGVSRNFEGLRNLITPLCKKLKSVKIKNY